VKEQLYQPEYESEGGRFTTPSLGR
jgi:hypothetical protein